jgi:hypothetical protein
MTGQHGEPKQEKENQNSMKNQMINLIVLLLGCVSFSPVANAVPNPVTSNVNVVNTPNVNVANTPMVTLSGTPTVSLAPGASISIANTPSVSLANTPDVNVANTPTVNVGNQPTVTVATSTPTPLLVRDVDNPARQAYQDIQIAYINGGEAVVQGAFRQVPAGKQLVIEFISVTALVPSTQILEQVNVNVRNSHTGDQLPNYQIDVNGKGQDPFALPASDLFVGSKQVRMYADPGSIPTFHALRNVRDGVATVEVDISGYLVDLP